MPINNLIVISILLSASSAGLLSIYNMQELSFCLWSASQIVIVLMVNYLLFVKAFPKQVSNADRLILLIIIMSAFFSRFYNLEAHPLLALGDEVRDGGQRAYLLLNGAIGTVYAQDWSQTLLWAKFVSLFLPYYGNDVLAYRIPSAIVSSLDCISIYFVGRALLGRVGGLVSYLVLLSLPVHFYFGRTEGLIASTSLYTSLLIALFCIRELLNRTQWFFSFGVLVALGIIQHASVRSAILVCCVYLLVYEVVNFRSYFGRVKTQIIVPYFAAFSGLLIGLGPWITIVGSLVWIGSGKFITVPSDATYMSFYFERVIRSLEWWGVSGGYVHFKEELNLGNYALPFLVPIGLLAATIFKPRLEALIVASLLAVIVPITNAAIIISVPEAHRGLPISPAISLLAGAALILPFRNRFSLATWRQKVINVIQGVLLILTVTSSSFALYQVYAADLSTLGRGEDMQSDMYIHAIKDVSRHLNAKYDCKKIKVKTRDGIDIIARLPIPHIYEYFEYFLYGHQIEAASSSEIKKSESDITLLCLTQNNIKSLRFIYQYCGEAREGFFFNKCPPRMKSFGILGIVRHFGVD